MDFDAERIAQSSSQSARMNSRASLQQKCLARHVAFRQSRAESLETRAATNDFIVVSR